MLNLAVLVATKKTLSTITIGMLEIKTLFFAFRRVVHKIGRVPPKLWKQFVSDFDPGSDSNDKLDIIFFSTLVIKEPKMR